MKHLNCSTKRFTEYYLDVHKSMLLLEDFTFRYNQDKPLRKQLRAGHLTLMHRLLNIQRIVLWKQQSGRRPLSPGTPLPYLSANNVYLGIKINVSGRTIQNLRQRLQEAGLVLDEVWHGSKANYEMRLNPEVIFLGRRGDRRNWISLFEGKAMTVEVSIAEKGHQYSGATNITDGDQQKTEDLEQQITDATEVWKTTATPVEIPLEPAIQQRAHHPSYEEKITVFSENLSSKCTLSLQDTNQLNQLEIDRCGKGAGTDVDRAGGQRRIFLTGYETDSDEHRKPPRVARRPPVGEERGVRDEEGEVRNEESGRFGDGVKGDLVIGRGQGAGRGEHCIPETFGGVVAGLPDKLGRRIFREVSKVWEVALEELYAGEWIANTERERAMARMAEYYVHALPARYAAGTTEICERIRLVRKWIDRGRQAGQERWVPIPSVYFDYRNTRGFGRTKAWFKKHIAKRREIGDNIAVAKAVGRYQRCCKEHSDAEGPMAVYQKLVTQLEGHGEEIVQRFHHAVK
ncbi:hypothetical protein [Flavilitoribacter nigricans]|uniref:Uncharacterized protein n=1 Tax=Flavilitoribacter nigricans (strain ATCC 23147 / DSM 23189 / NBRC 102662 / NCIMB 1420 / SS-2) TaxID=1122177 RepID=A0A2D0N2C5_FLAN2|nr:hypothetical protein [Flavilitoribacter nigricans]PHN01883.1 hypothetical protein CRP01_35190 [Flavilitoribacter nigricans DSM 23189 = NBRC 102662]